MTSAFPPALVLALGAFLLPVAGPRFRAALVLGLPLVTLVLVTALPDGRAAPVAFLDYGLTLVHIDPLGRLFAIIFALMAFAGGLFALRQQSTLELVSALVYAGGAIGVALAGDLISLFVWWEVMALASSTVIISVGGEHSVRVAMRYFMVHMIGGSLLLAGVLLHLDAGGAVTIGELDAGTASGALILAGVLVNAAAPPISAWLADAYPEGSFSGTVFLSAFTTKAAVYVLIRVFPGTEILVPVGLFMIFYGIIYALLENDMRRILAYSIVNQVGFMVTGAGIGTQMALNGAAAHAFAHIIYKALLLMSAGSVLYMTGKRKCSDLGGLFQSMPVTTICGTIGALAISSFPWTSGFVSKSMISQAAGDEYLVWTWFLLMAASAGVFLHAGIKFPWFVFFQKDSGLRPPDPPWNMQVAMIFFAVLCIALGVWPEPLYALLPYPVDYVPYTVPHVVNMLQLLLFSGLAFFLMLPMMQRTLTITLDFDWLYRHLAPRLIVESADAVANAARAFRTAAHRHLGNIVVVMQRRIGPHSALARSTETAGMVLVVVAVLSVYLVLTLIL
ncbi:MAG: Na(+)/H(+) antiporter subunit D [Gammaproteobacteria bacterium]|nr:Na(+)/H(+) antiporter subunit D [Gammaproteobacteria bacterium]